MYNKYLLKNKKRLTSFQIIIFGFAIVILTGTLLLMLPISGANHRATPFQDALFTSTSAVCVTGLVIHDTATYWSDFGQMVILSLIQIGGMGVVTVAVSTKMLPHIRKERWYYEIFVTFKLFYIYRLIRVYCNEKNILFFI